MENYYTAQEVADRLKVKRQTVYTWIREGRLQADKIGRTRRISETQLQNFMAEQGGLKQ
ncbi:MAG: DNA-binding protein [Clostridia bacterium]|nr:DNA-binding protein [Clostridia bacterium]